MKERWILLLRFLPAVIFCGFLSFGEAVPALWWNAVVMICAVYLIDAVLSKYMKGKSPAGKLLLALALFFLYLFAAAAIPNSISVPLSKPAKTVEVRGDTVGEERARLVTTNQEALEQRLRMIDEAQMSIVLNTFEWYPDHSGTDVMAALYRAADRGVQVRILVDGFTAAMGLDTDPAFCALAAHPGVEVKVYNRLNLLLPWRSASRMHEKYLIIDDACYLLGGRNTSDLFLGSYPVSRTNDDMEVLVWQPSAAPDSSLSQLRAYFEAMWAQRYCTAFAGHRGGETQLRAAYEALQTENAAYLAPYDYPSHTSPTRQITLFTGPTVPLKKEPVLFYELSSLMQAARERVIVHTPYAICNKPMYDELTKIASGVPRAELMLNSPQNGANLFGSSDYLTQKARLLRTGFSLYEYNGGASYHGKLILIDSDISVVGSFNMDMRSAYLDTELMVVIHSEEINQQLEACMAQTRLTCSQVLTSTEYVPGGTVSELGWKKMLFYDVLKVVSYPLRHLL